MKPVKAAIAAHQFGLAQRRQIAKGQDDRGPRRRRVRERCDKDLVPAARLGTIGEFHPPAGPVAGARLHRRNEVRKTKREGDRLSLAQGRRERPGRGIGGEHPAASVEQDRGIGQRSEQRWQYGPGRLPPCGCGRGERRGRRRIGRAAADDARDRRSRKRENDRTDARRRSERTRGDEDQEQDCRRRGHEPFPAKAAECCRPSRRRRLARIRAGQVRHAIASPAALIGLGGLNPAAALARRRGSAHAAPE
jgi:hypothetical protein